MTHNEFNLKEDIIFAIGDFIYSNNLISKHNAINKFAYDKLKELYKIPLSIAKKMEMKSSKEK